MEQVEDDVKLRRVVEGRAVVSRAWITRYTGAGRSTVARWYALRHEQPEERRHPERVVTVDRVDYYDQEAVEAFWAAHQEGVGTARLGVSGRRSGTGHGEPSGGRPVSAERALAVEVALAELRRAGGYRRGLAARLARAHGGGARTWERAVTDARTAHATEAEHQTQRSAPQPE
ncbi:hypothetical protein [Streptomyces sp. NRRL_B-2557]|uniref:hypothetical protein n=1 Tax=Streptomyces sp. NRRL_B-2557 TaxID=3028698 RepID=UPI0029B832B7|nr:hypothetical protein [Streptomyces sp. NRRL_B-2557]MDX2748583.1 hypothetical protein [Streptomyces sp. NRRL_B-2557]